MKASNIYRIDRIARIIEEEQTRGDPHEDDKTTLTDLLADIMHYCKATSIDFLRVLALAKTHYDIEAHDNKDSELW